MVLFLLKIITVACSVFLIHQSLTRFLHIFQLTFYNFTEFFPTIKKTKECVFGKLEALLVIMCIITSITNKLWFYIIWIPLVLIVIYFTNILKPKEKKKFVITFRVKIMFTFAYIFEILLLILPTIYFAYINSLIFYIFAIILSLYKHTGLLFAIIGNALTKPVMAINNKKFIKEAKNIINSNTYMKIIGITGSYGKTSTKNVINEILAPVFSTVMTPKSFNTTLGVVKTIRENIKPYTEMFVCEMGAARLGEIAEICDIAKPDFSIITSIGPQHLTSFKTIENVQRGKFEIVTESKESSVAILNVDNMYINSGIDMYLDGRKVIKYGIDSGEKLDYKACNIKMTDEGSTFEVHYEKGITTVETKLLGRHNIYNILCAFALAKELGVEDDKIVRSIKKLKPVEHRLELKQMGGIPVLDDSFNSNPEGSKSAIECLNMFENRFKVLVTPGMIELGKMDYELNKKLGKYACTCDFVILVGDKNTKPLKDGMDEEKYQNYKLVKDIYEAFDMLNKLKAEHDNIIALIENDLPDSYS